MSELDGAMATTQLPKLDAIVAKRRKLGDRLNRELSQIRGIIPQVNSPDAECSYFFYLLRIDETIITCSRKEFLSQLEDEGIPASGAYVPTPIYKSPYFQAKSFFPGGVWPAEVVAGRRYDYTSVQLPGAEKAVATGIQLYLNEGFEDTDIDDYIEAIRIVAGRNST